MSVMLRPCMLCVSLLMCLFVWVLRVCELFGETICNVFGCSCYFVVPYVLFVFLYVGVWLGV